MTTNDSCSICLDDLSLPYTLECNHTFCYLCIKQAYKKSNKLCPLCRHTISDQIYEHAKANNDIDASNAIWLYSGRNFGWWKYDVVTSQLLENAYQNSKKSIDVNILGVNYTIDFEKLQQSNNISKATRKIKRLEDEDLVKGISGIRI